MRCKQGDLAVIVGKGDGPRVNGGKVVTCIEFVGAAPGMKNAAVSDCWLVDAEIVWERSPSGEKFTAPYQSDSRMIPLRDTDGEDEMLTVIKRKQSDLVGKGA
jgi:hypothetical protein